ncbi:MAG: beta-L-arabinofuranosidase domain-containing protein, partial [Bauldia sp.]
MRQYSPVNFSDVTIEGDFWRERLDTVLTRTIPSQHRRLAEHGLLESLTVPKPPPPLRIPRGNHNFTTQIFWDSDVGKWIEAASYALSHRRDATIEGQIDEITEWLAKAQLPDGYLNCWYIGREIDKRWTNLRDNHELYCAGHMLEGAIAYYQATGNRRLLDVMLKYVDHIAETFGPGEDQKHGYCGHQEIELALIKLYAATGDRKHLDLAAYFINERGKLPNYFDIEAIARGDDPKDYWAKTYEYNQSHKPVREQDRVVGHAVRAMYMYAAMADLAAEFDDPSLKRALEVLWRDVTSRQMYVTAGLGPSKHNEGFTTYYDLPNDTAYAETCASVALIFWAHRMLNIDLDGRYADIMELALYNGALSGLSRDGEHYFYENPLESDGKHRRWKWHNCPCCTMNVSRLVASIGGYFYSTGKDVLAVHLYGGNSATIAVGDRKVRVKESSTYPWSGSIRVAIDPETAGEFTVKLRIPGWAKDASARINGAQIDVPGNLKNGYLEIRRTWTEGDAIDLELPMPVERIYAHPNVRMDAGRVAIKRGPLVYCVEQTDNPKTPVVRIRLPRDAGVAAHERRDLFGGIVAVVANGKAAGADDWNNHLYRTEPPAESAASWTAVPYYLWNNREPGRMLVWI